MDDIPKCEDCARTLDLDLAVRLEETAKTEFLTEAEKESLVRLATRLKKKYAPKGE